MMMAADAMMTTMDSGHFHDGRRRLPAALLRHVALPACTSIVISQSQSGGAVMTSSHQGPPINT